MVEVRLRTRQLAVLQLLAKGHTADAIGRRLHISPRTAQKHIEQIYERLGVRDRLTAVLRANALGLVRPPAKGDR